MPSPEPAARTVESRASLREQLLSSIRSWDVHIDGGIAADTPLIESGQFDSLALFNLVVWIEQQVGATIDPTSVDIAVEWNSIDSIVSFIERHRGVDR